MKAKEYLAKYKEELVDPETAGEALCCICEQIIREAGAVSIKRGARNIDGLLHETRDKWRAVCARLHPSIRNLPTITGLMSRQIERLLNDNA